MGNNKLKPLITVLMSVYNGERYLREAIESILNQTFTDFEFLIINDGSTDSTRDIIISYTDSRIRFIDNEQNIGLTKSLNKGIDLARGKYIARMDADDISMPERLEVQYNFLEKNIEYSLVSSGAYLIDENNNQIGELYRPYNYEMILGYIFFFNPIIHPSVLFEKKEIIECGKYNEKILKVQDYDLWFTLVRNKKRMCNLPDILIKHREHETSIESISFGEKNFLLIYL